MSTLSKPAPKIYTSFSIRAACLPVTTTPGATAKNELINTLIPRNFFLPISHTALTASTVTWASASSRTWKKKNVNKIIVDHSYPSFTHPVPTSFSSWSSKVGLLIPPSCLLLLFPFPNKRRCVQPPKALKPPISPNPNPSETEMNPTNIATNRHDLNILLSICKLHPLYLHMQDYWE